MSALEGRRPLRWGRGGLCGAGEDPVPLPPGHGGVPGLQAAAAADGGVIREMNGAVEPPGSMVVPEVMVFPRGALAAGEIGWVGGHGDVLAVWAHHEAKKQKARLRSSSRAIYSGDCFSAGLSGPARLIPQMVSLRKAPWRLC